MSDLAFVFQIAALGEASVQPGDSARSRTGSVPESEQRQQTGEN